ncbi:hypothetical protein BCEN4_170104 [Burkholderia cenocepacia]|nr:hypothetical protein BCEN4_170104 [Burkholderia cenocepacia]
MAARARQTMPAIGRCGSGRFGPLFLFRFEHRLDDQVDGRQVIIVAAPVDRLLDVCGNQPAATQPDECVDDGRIVAVQEAGIRERQLLDVQQRLPAHRANGRRVGAAAQTERPLRGAARDTLQIDDRPLRGALEVDGIEAGLLGIECGSLEHGRLTKVRSSVDDGIRVKWCKSTVNIYSV